MKLARDSKSRAYEERYLALAREIILKHLDRDRVRVFLFGSRAKRAHSRNADLDVGILGPGPVDPKTLAGIREELEESVVPYHVDLIDFSQVDEKFKEEALREIVLWNPGKNSA
ncbi:MAG: nucleotidyltransferase family protein [Thermoanaerobaculia bacterium]